MTINGWLQIALFCAIVAALTKPLGGYMTRVFAGERVLLAPMLRPVERLLYRACGVAEAQEQHWTTYGFAMLAFSIAGFASLYALQRLQQFLPFNPMKTAAVAPDVALDTSVSFITNTNRQSCRPDRARSRLAGHGRARRDPPGARGRIGNTDNRAVLARRRGAKVAALDLGTDDFVAKPFGIDELFARIRAAERHRLQQAGERPAFRSGDLSVDLVRRIVRARGAEVKLTPREYELLRLMVAHAGKVLTHRTILRAVWGGDTDVQYLRIYIRALRQKLEADPERPAHILTETGVGYRLRALD